MITHLLIDMINIFKVINGEYPSKIILSFAIQRDLEEELEQLKNYKENYKKKCQFKGIDLEYSIQEDFISLEKC